MTKNNFAYFALMLFFSLGWNNDTFGQLSKEDKLDSLRAKFVKDSARIFRAREVSFLFAIDGRSSFIRRLPIDVQGIQVGISSGRVSFGIGGYKALQGFQSAANNDDGIKTVDSTTVGFFTFFYEQTFIDRKWWEIGALMEAGTGNYTYIHNVYSNNVSVNVRRSGSFAHAGLGIDITLKLFPWLGLNVMGGYRLATITSDFNFNGPYFSYGVAPKLGEIYRLFKFHEKKGKYTHDKSMINDPPPWK